MNRRLVITLGSLLAVSSAAAMGLNLFAPLAACRFHLCPETVAVQEARRQLLEATPQSLANSVRLYREALNRNPASPYRWCDLGEALLVSGDVEGARRCFSQADRYGPNIPTTLLHIAGFHMRQNETRLAVQTMARVLSLTPEYDELLFGYFDQMGAGVDEVLRYGLPGDRRAAEAYFRHVLASAQPEVAEKVWQWAGANGLQEDTLAGEFAAYLLKNGRPESAAESWAKYLGPRRGDYLRDSLLFNGGFELEMSRCPLDWRISELPEVDVSRDGNIAHSGNYSLRLDFRGTRNLNYRHVSNVAAVRPGRTRFRAYVKTAGLTTDKGVGFRIYDVDSPTRLDLRTEQVQGTVDWRLIERTFVTPPGTRVLAVQVCRLPSLKFDSNIAGSVWIDDAVLERLPDR